MKHPTPGFSRKYRSALRSHLEQGGKTDPKMVSQISLLIRSSEMSVLEFAGLHEQILAMDLLSACPTNKKAALSIRNETKCVIMEIHDDGRSFQVKRTMEAGGIKRLGLLGIRERVEMVGGVFEIQSAPGKGTRVIARIPSGKSSTRKPSGTSVPKLQ